jgi:hypothetical protein
MSLRCYPWCDALGGIGGDCYRSHSGKPAAALNIRIASRSLPHVFAGRPINHRFASRGKAPLTARGAA